MKKLFRRIPPYNGKEPYLFLNISPADAKDVLPLVTRLAARGCRIWYGAGRSGSKKENEAQTARMLGASLTVLYLSENARNDTDFKSSALLMQNTGKPIICIDADEGDKGLSFGLTKAEHLRLRDYPSAGELEGALIRTEGFSHELIGEAADAPGFRRVLALILCGMIALIGLALFFGWFTPKYHDAVFFEDAVLREGVRASVGGGEITEEAAEALSRLRLREAPGSWEELSLLPSLERVELPADCAEAALPLLDEDGITVVLYGR